jgi:hypothetical protein
LNTAFVNDGEKRLDLSQIKHAEGTRDLVVCHLFAALSGISGGAPSLKSIVVAVRTINSHME